MPVLFILTRILFVACMVFIIGYVFGNFSKSATLSVFAKVATVLTIVLFIGTSILLFRGGPWRHGHRAYNGQERGCYYGQKDSAVVRY